jgi:hypothetical protein
VRSRFNRRRRPLNNIAVKQIDIRVCQAMMHGMRAYHLATSCPFCYAPFATLKDSSERLEYLECSRCGKQWATATTRAREMSRDEHPAIGGTPPPVPARKVSAHSIAAQWSPSK